MISLEKAIVILDFGSQYTQLIARRVREMGVYCEIFSCHVEKSDLKTIEPLGFILSGGPSSVIERSSLSGQTSTNKPDSDSPHPPDGHLLPTSGEKEKRNNVIWEPQTLKAPEWIFTSNLPILGICYGMQTMAAQLGGVVEAAERAEFGYADVRVCRENKLLSDVYDHLDEQGQKHLDVWMSHGDHVTKVPPQFHVICETSNAPIAAMAHESKPWFGLQFHPEVTHTLQGERILKQFVLSICAAQATWTPEHMIETFIETIRQKVGSDKVILGLSGGVDSSVVAALLHQAIGEQLICVFVDTGLLRLNEKETVLSLFQAHLGVHVEVVEAEERFLSALAGITCPEQKRKIVGKTFIDVFNERAEALKDVTWLAQGTIYSDVIESAGSKGASETIKSHHNVGGLPDTMHLKLLEPVRELFKDEVRQLGLKLGLPADMIHRHPFPGPGLSIRVLGEVKKAFLDKVRLADKIFIEALREADLYHQVSQAFALYLPVKSVGVTGDGRRYDDVICLRAVNTSDFMTATWSHLPWDFLSKVSNRIINEVPGISRVTYDISSKPPATIEWE